MGGSTSSVPEFGFRIIAINDDSPFNKKTDVFTDVIIGINEKGYLKNYNFVIENLSKNTKPIMSIYNIYKNETRDVQIVLDLENIDEDKQFEIAGKIMSSNDEDEKAQLYKEQIEQFLGIKFNQADTKYVHSKILRCTQVYDRSPGKEANIIPRFDFILDCLDFEYKNTDEFIKQVYEIYSKTNKPRVKQVQFNVLNNCCRVCILEPNRDWGDQGLLGIELGEGKFDDFRTIYDITQEYNNNPQLEMELSKISKENSSVNAEKEVQQKHQTSLNQNLWKDQKVANSVEHKNPFQKSSSGSIDKIEGYKSRTISKDSVDMVKENIVTNMRKIIYCLITISCNNTA